MHGRLAVWELSDVNFDGKREEGIGGDEPEIDLDSDPFVSDVSGPDQNWVNMIKALKPRQPNSLRRINKEPEFGNC
jgi:hypothetical protein